MRYMDYENFKKEFNRYNDHDWTEDDKRYTVPNLKDGNHWLKIVEGYDKVGPVDNDGNFYHPEAQNDMVNSPAHYTRGSQECIDTIEQAIQDAPDPVTGLCHAQTLRYLIRLWLKNTPLENARKARWYLDRLIKHLEDKK